MTATVVSPAIPSYKNTAFCNWYLPSIDADDTEYIVTSYAASHCAQLIYGVCCFTDPTDAHREQPAVTEWFIRVLRGDKLIMAMHLGSLIHGRGSLFTIDRQFSTPFLLEDGDVALITVKFRDCISTAGAAYRGTLDMTIGIVPA